MKINRIYIYKRFESPMEIVIKLGKYEGTSEFSPYINKELFNDFLQLPDFLEKADEVDETIYNYSGDYRKTVIAAGRAKSMERRVRTRTINYIDKNLQVTMETRTSVGNIPSQTLKSTRERHRITKYHKDFLWKYDFSVVHGNPPKYQVEIEYIPGKYSFAIEQKVREIGEQITMFNVLRDLPNQFTKITNKVVNLESKSQLEPYMNFVVSDKKDGIRALLLFKNREIWMLNESTNRILAHSDGKYNGTVLDGESIHDHLFSVFDILYYKGVDVRNLEFKYRYSFMEDIIRDLDCDNILLTDYRFPTKSKSIFSLAKDLYYNTKRDYDIDGIIFTPLHGTYHMTNYKWKAIHTLDFVIRIPSPGHYDLYYKKDGKNTLYKKNVTIDLAGHTIGDNEVYELIPGPNDDWKVLRPRPEKTVIFQKTGYFGPNDAKVVEQTLEYLKSGGIDIFVD